MTRLIGQKYALKLVYYSLIIMIIIIIIISSAYNLSKTRYYKEIV